MLYDPQKALLISWRRKGNAVFPRLVPSWPWTFHRAGNTLLYSVKPLGTIWTGTLSVICSLVCHRRALVCEHSCLKTAYPLQNLGWRVRSFLALLHALSLFVFVHALNVASYSSFISRALDL